MHEARVDKSVIRIQSAHNWPERIIFDTNLPTIIPPASQVLPNNPITHPREAIAGPNVVSQQTLKHSEPVKAKRKVARRAATRMAAYRTDREAPAGW
jgi:hypothetical protein